MDYLSSLKRRLADNEASIALLKDRLAGLELEQHKLAIALEVVSGLELNKPAQQATDAVEHNDKQRNLIDNTQRLLAAAQSTLKPSGKELILKTLAEAGFALTRMDVVSRLAAAGYELNSTTVGSTLSRLVDAGLVEKASHSQYQIKRTPAVRGEEKL